MTIADREGASNDPGLCTQDDARGNLSLGPSSAAMANFGKSKQQPATDLDCGPCHAACRPYVPSMQYDDDDIAAKRNKQPYPILAGLNILFSMATRYAKPGKSNLFLLVPLSRLT